MAYLILAPTPEVRRWPFYGHAVETVTRFAAWRSRETRVEAAEHRAVLVSRLAEARAVVADIETDIAAIDSLWSIPATNSEP